MKSHTSLLIIGAGPFGLAMAAYAKHHDIDHVMLGKSMGFWKSNMPKGMYLRSECDWHLDPLGVHTIQQYLTTKKLTPKDVEPLSLAFYLDYAAWFQEQKALEASPNFVQRLDHVVDRKHRFEASLDDGQSLTADHVVVALGYRYFKHVPEEVAGLFPEGRYTHTCDLVDFEFHQGKRCLIVGGRQSAFEWAALLAEFGAAAVHVCHRHPTPAFRKSDWSWVNKLVDGMVDDPAWFRNLTKAGKEDVNRRLWAEGRLKLEPWLGPRVRRKSITLWPDTKIVGCTELSSGELEVRLDRGDSTLTVDHAILATGYKMDIDRVPFLAHGNLLEQLETRNGYPVLDEHLQTNIPGLFMTSMPATQDFGPFFAFTVAVRTSAKLIGKSLKRDRGQY